MPVNEINNEYHTADYERWQKQGFVVGIEIFRSKSNKCSCDICDNMAGVYPKIFRFLGWCEGCGCLQVPIMSGEVPKEMMIKDAPKRASEYITQHYEKIKHHYWVDALLKL